MIRISLVFQPQVAVEPLKKIADGRPEKKSPLRGCFRGRISSSITAPSNHYGHMSPVRLGHEKPPQLLAQSGGVVEQKRFNNTRQLDMATIPQLHPETPPASDYFCVSAPTEAFDDLVGDVLAILDPLTGSHEAPGLYRLLDAPGGSVKYGRRHQVGTIGFSGAVLSLLRSRRVFNELLFAIGYHEHRVTGLHVAQDYHVPAAPYVRHAYREGNARRVFLTRKAVRTVSRVARQAIYEPTIETGTCYLGTRGASVMLTCYDKRNEMLSAVLENQPHASAAFLGFFDPGHLLRYELKLGRNVGMTLRDVADPLAVFWHHLRDSGLPLACPEGVPDWQPMSEGYVLPPRPEKLPWQQMQLIVDNSPDVERAVKLAAAAGRAGPAMLVSMLQKRVQAILEAVDRPLLGGAEQGRVTVPA